MSSWEEELKKLARDARLEPKIDRFFFLRHGETDHNKREYVQGWLDVPLNATGEAQALRAAKVLLEHPISHIISSPQIRARRTAELVASLTGHAVERFDIGFREKGFGPYENGPRPPQNAWSLTDEGVETLSDFTTRVMAAFQTHLVEGVPLVVAHGGVRRVLLYALGLAQEDHHFGNAVPLEFVRRGKVWTVKVLARADKGGADGL